VDKKTIAIIVLSTLLVISIGLYIYQEIRLAKTPNVIHQLREDNDRLTATGNRLIENVDRLNEYNRKLESRINDLSITNGRLEESIREQELVNQQYRTRIDRLTSNYESTIPIYNDIREIFEYYEQENQELSDSP